MNRDDLIKALGSAYAEKKEEEDQSTVVSAVAGEKDVLRLLTNDDDTSRKNLYENHPDAMAINQLADALESTHTHDITTIGQELLMKFDHTIEQNDEAKISEMVEKCKEMYIRLQRTDKNSPECALIYMMISDMVKQL